MNVLIPQTMQVKFLSVPQDSRMKYVSNNDTCNYVKTDFILGKQVPGARDCTFGGFFAEAVPVRYTLALAAVRDSRRDIS